MRVHALRVIHAHVQWLYDLPASEAERGLLFFRAGVDVDEVDAWAALPDEDMRALIGLTTQTVPSPPAPDERW